MEAIQYKKTLYQLERKCWRKKGHWPTLKAARRRARQIFRESGVQLYAYVCEGCGEVHLTKSRSAKGKVI